ASDLLRALELNPQAHFKLSGGKIETQSALAHYFSKIFSSSSAIASRNRDLRAKMAEVLQNSGLPDLSRGFAAAAGRVDGQQMMSKALRADLAFCIREQQHAQLEKKTAQAVRAAAKALPEDCREAATRFALMLIRQNGLGAKPELAAQHAERIMQELQGNEHLLHAMRYDAPFTAEQTEAFTAVLHAQVVKDFQDDVKEGHMTAEGLHDNLVKDLPRFTLQTINGKPVPLDHKAGSKMIADQLPLPSRSGRTEENYQRQLDKMLAMRQFVSTLCTQAGTPAAFSKISFAARTGERTDLPPHILHPEVDGFGIGVKYNDRTCSLDIRDGKAYVRFEQKIKIVPQFVDMGGLHGEFGGNMPEAFAGALFQFI
ncbi:MAG: hypothetical protein HUK26_09890, partial [Duodenibacillus sp.]|nr:hypothetical protein [Duodenibacillus sp.]